MVEQDQLKLCKEFSSEVVRSRLAKIIMNEYVTFPILVSNKSPFEISDKVGYMLLKGMGGPLLFHEKDTEFEILEASIKDLIVQPKEKPGLLHNLRGTWGASRLMKLMNDFFILTLITI